MADGTVLRGRLRGKPVHIYTLKDPVTGAVRYVGATTNALRVRLHHHTMAAKGRRKSKLALWFKSLLDVGSMPAAEAIETVPADGDWPEAEKRWIAHFRAEGADLVNSTDGGPGINGFKASAELRRAVTARLLSPDNPRRGSPKSQEVVEKVRAARRANPMAGVHLRSGALHGRARPVIVDGVRYATVTEAGQALGVTDTAIHGRIRRGKAHYADVLPGERPRNRAVVVDGVRYESASAAARALGIRRSAVSHRLKMGYAHYAED